MSVACLSGSEVRGAVDDLNKAEAMEPEDDAAEAADQLLSEMRCGCK